MAKWIAGVARLIVLALVVGAGATLAAGPAVAETRVALVIGNAAYAHGGRLTNPANDAAAVAEALRRVGFTVVSQSDLGKTGLEAALKAFTRAAAGADIAVVYYAGHGIEKGGTNYLIPVDATLAADSDIDFEAIPLDLVMHAVGGATRLKVVILDACRNNPFRDSMRRSSGTRGIGQGLAKPPDPEEGDMLVAYAAEAGSTAEDGAGANSPFALALAHHLTDPGVDIRIMFGKIRDDVRTATGMRQEPAVYESLGGEQFFMAPAAGVASVAGETAVAPAGPPDVRTLDLAFWQSVQASNDPAQLRAYLTEYPDGAFAAVARAKVAALQSRAPTSAPSASRGQSVGGFAVATATPAVAVAPPPSAPQGPMTMRPRSYRFDGFWQVAQTCPNPEDSARPFRPPPFTVLVREGQLHGDRGMVGAPGWLAIDGAIGPAGMATLEVHGLVGRANKPGLIAPGQPFRNVLTGHFDEHQGFARSACVFTFTRE